jgi:MSHA biogenesis protein MshI
MRIDLSRLRDRLRKLASPRPGKRLWAVADLQPNRITAVLVAPGGAGQRPVVHQAGVIEYEGNAAVPDALAALAHKLRAGGQRWALLLPREDYRVSVMDEPEVPAAELAQSLRWQLTTALDFPVDDAAIDFMKIPAAPSAQVRPPEIYAVAARGTAVNTQAELFRQARLALWVIDIRETAQRNLAALLERPDELLAMVAFGESDVQITFSWQRELIMDRLIAEHVHTGDTPERRAASFERVQLQLQYSLDAVRTSYPFLQSARIVSAGAPESFVEQLKDMVVDPVEELVPDALFDLSHVPQLKDPLVFMRYFHALGAALRGREIDT